jgi:hypothetical protein
MHILQYETNPKEGADSLQISNTTTKRSLPLDKKAIRNMGSDSMHAPYLL